MTFIESVKICFSKYATFSGRATRSEFWWWALFVFVGIVATTVISERLSWAFTIATLIPYFAVAARRLHDTDRSGWTQLVGFVPFVGWALMIYWLAQDSKSTTRF